MGRAKDFLQKIGLAKGEASRETHGSQALFSEWKQDYALAKARDETGREPLVPQLPLLGQTDQASELLTSLQSNRLGGASAAYSAVAIFRMGRVTEAIAVLDQAELAFGGTAVLRGAREYIKSGKPVFAMVNVSWENDRSRVV